MTDRDELIDEGVNELVRVLRLTGYDGVQPGNGTDAVGSYRYITFHHPTHPLLSRRILALTLIMSSTW